MIFVSSNRRKIFQRDAFTSQDYSPTRTFHMQYIWTGTRTYMLINMAKYVSTQSWPLLKIYIYIYIDDRSDLYCALDT